MNHPQHIEFRTVPGHLAEALIRTSSPRGAIPKENLEGAWTSLWCDVPNRTLALRGCEVMYVHVSGEGQECDKLLQPLDHYQRPEDTVPFVRLVEFSAPVRPMVLYFQKLSIGRRFRQGEPLAVATYGNLFPNVAELRFFPVPSSMRRTLYSGLHAGWSNIEALQYLCVSILSVMAYIYTRWMCQTRVAPPQHTRKLGHAILLSKPAVLLVL